MLRPPFSDLVLGIALPVPDPQLPEPLVDHRPTAEPRRKGCRRLQGTGERARHQPVDRLRTKHLGDGRGRPNPSRLDALIEPTHRTALAVRGRAGMSDQVHATHPSLPSVAQARCPAAPNGGSEPTADASPISASPTPQRGGQRVLDIVTRVPCADARCALPRLLASRPAGRGSLGHRLAARGDLLGHRLLGHGRLAGCGLLPRGDLLGRRLLDHGRLAGCGLRA